MDGGAWPFLVRGLICQVNSVNERDLHALLPKEVTGAFAYVFLRDRGGKVGLKPQ